MRVAYLDCFAGISGDMFLGALIDAGVSSELLSDAIEALNIGARLNVKRTDRSGISCTKVQVLEGDQPVEESLVSSGSFRKAPSTGTQSRSPEITHSHGAGQVHSHGISDHGSDQNHGRPLSVIRSLIEAAALNDTVKRMAIQTFELLGATEAKIHGTPIEQVHFHEVGAVDAIVDIVAASVGIHALGIDRWYCSKVNVGAGMVDCAHGRFPVPAPATADLLRGVPTYSAHVEQELVTPTGAAILRSLSAEFGPQPAMRVKTIGYGAGSRNPAGFPNVVRLSIGESDQTAASASVMVLETAIDDLSPQILAHVTERALALGALDVMSTAVQMKKGRLGTLITILADRDKVPALEDLLLRETSTLGIRIREERRSCLERKHVSVRTPYGEVRIKVGLRGGEIFNAAPEFEDCRIAGERHGIPVKQVQQAAIAAYYAMGVDGQQ